MKTVRVLHVGFTVADLERSTRFYELFGFQRFRHFAAAGPDVEEGTETPGADIEIRWLRHPDNDTMVELLRYRDQPAGRAAHNSKVGAAHLCLGVEDVDAEYERLRNAGVTFLSPPKREADGTVWVYMRDPDGNATELMQRPA